MLLAGEMIKTKKNNVLLAGEMFEKIGMCFWLGKYQQKINMLLAGEMLKFFFFFFRKWASGWGNSKKVKNVKRGGTMFVSRVCTNIVPPTFNIFDFLEFPQPEAHFRKSF